MSRKGTRHLFPKHFPLPVVLVLAQPTCNLSLFHLVLLPPWKWKWKLVARSCLTFCDPMDCSLPGSSVCGILQAIVLEWVAISFSRGSSWPGSPALQTDSLPTELLGKPLVFYLLKIPLIFPLFSIHSITNLVHTAILTDLLPSFFHVIIRIIFLKCDWCPWPKYFQWLLITIMIKCLVLSIGFMNPSWTGSYIPYLYASTFLPKPHSTDSVFSWELYFLPELFYLLSLAPPHQIDQHIHSFKAYLDIVPPGEDFSASFKSCFGILQGFLDSSVGKESACNAGDPGLIPGLGRSVGEGPGCPLMYSWASLVAQLVKNPPPMQETWFGKIPRRREWLHTPVFWRIQRTV